MICSLLNSWKIRNENGICFKIRHRVDIDLYFVNLMKMKSSIPLEKFFGLGL